MASLSLASPVRRYAHAAVLQRHARVDAVGVELELAPRLAGELEVVELGSPVVALGKRLPGQVEEPGLVRPVVQPVEADGEVGHAEPRPAIHRLLRDHLVDLAAALEHRRDDAGIAGGLLVLGERLEQREQRPDVVRLVLLAVADGPEPAVGLLVIEDEVDRLLDLGLERRRRRGDRPAGRGRRASRGRAPSPRPCRRTRRYP